jgi:peroxiredoxin
MKQTINNWLAVCIILATSWAANAQQGYKTGDLAADFSLKNIDGKMVSLANFKSAKGFIVIFTCNHCPFSKAYEDRIISLQKNFGVKGYPVIAINPNDPNREPEDSYENMQKRAKEKKFNFPYLIDKTQETAKTYGATRTPHVFVLQKENDNYRVAYIGAIDDNFEESKLVKQKFVEEAIADLLANREVANPTTKAIGCGIKWKK